MRTPIIIPYYHRSGGHGGRMTEEQAEVIICLFIVCFAIYAFSMTYTYLKWLKYKSAPKEGWFTIKKDSFSEYAFWGGSSGGILGFINFIGTTFSGIIGLFVASYILSKIIF